MSRPALDRFFYDPNAVRNAIAYCEQRTHDYYTLLRLTTWVMRPDTTLVAPLQDWGPGKRVSIGLDPRGGVLHCGNPANSGDLIVDIQTSGSYYTELYMFKDVRQAFAYWLATRW